MKDSSREYIRVAEALRHSKQIVGATIVKVEPVSMGDEDYLGPDEHWHEFELRMPNGDTVIMVPSRDPEMNGPGHLVIETVHSVGGKS
jgi:hypothetical protein